MFILYINYYLPSLFQQQVILSLNIQIPQQFRSISYSTHLGAYISWFLRSPSGKRLACCELWDFLALSHQPKSSTKDFGNHGNDMARLYA